jgi:hypothetical protein
MRTKINAINTQTHAFVSFIITIIIIINGFASRARASSAFDRFAERRAHNSNFRSERDTMTLPLSVTRSIALSAPN